ncbi:MAG: hypothetical protein MJZ23_03235 [Paludibacteraceae bacterium]|nr:hypothetical protein [Paludibacteraceae bacterium]
MNSSFNYKYLVHWLIYIAVQVLVLNGVDYLQMATPFLFILFLINLPADMARIPFLLTAFVTGLVVDVFSSTAGIHCTACVFIAYLKPLFCKALGPSDALTLTPSFRSFGQSRYLQYALSMVAIHHALFFFMENGSTNMLLSVLFRVVQSIIFTMLLVFSVEYFKYRHSSNEN